MDLTRFSWNPALAENARVQSRFFIPFYEKLLSTLFEANENAYVKSTITKDRELIFMMPAFYWLTSGKSRQPQARALVLAPDAESAEILYHAAQELAKNLEAVVRLAILAGTEIADDPAVTNLVDANLVVADFDSFMHAIKAGKLSGRSFDFVVIDHAELIADLPYEILKKTLGHLLPSWERKTLVITGKHTPRAKNLAWEFADNPRELSLQESLGFAGLMKAQSFDVAEKDKVRLLLSIAAKNPSKTIAVFCNLKRTAQELAFRLQKNAVPVDYIVGNLMVNRKQQIAQKALSQAASKGFVIVLTDDGAAGLEGIEFPILVNFDIPLEPELYASRIAYLSKNPEEAQLFNFVCERYMYGVPAIERLIDAPLNPQSVQSLDDVPVDLSAGLEYIPPEHPERGRPSGRDGRPGRFGSSDRSARPSTYERAGQFEGSGRLERSEPSEDTENRKLEGSRPAHQKKPRWNPEEPHSTRHASSRQSSSQPLSNRQSSRARKPDGHVPAQTSESTENLYALSTEERLALFRKKYEKTMQARDASQADRAGSSSAVEGKRDGTQRARPKRDKNSTGAKVGKVPASEDDVSHEVASSAVKAGNKTEQLFSDPNRSATLHDSARETSIKSNETSKPQTAAAPEPQVTSAPEHTTKGIFSKLQGLLGGKKD